MMRYRHVALATGCLLAMAACTGLPNGAAGEGILPLQLAYVPKERVAAPFRTAFVDVGRISKASVTVTGPGMASPVNAGAPIAITDGAAATALQVVVPAGGNRVISARALDTAGNPMSVSHQVKGVASVISGMNPVTEVSWRTTLTAQVVDALMAASSPYAETVDVAQLQTIVDQAVQPQPTSAAVPFMTHPSLYDPAVIANAIIANGGAVPAQIPVNAYTAPGSITGHVTGVNAGETVYVQADDPGSQPAAVQSNGDYTIPNVTPGNGITVRVRNATASMASGVVNVTSGAATSANLAVPADGFLSNALYNGAGLSNQVIRWTRMPVRVLFVRPSVTAVNDPTRMDWNRHTHEDEVIDAFGRWSAALNGALSFAYANALDSDPALETKKAAADIVVEWTLDTFDGLFGETTPAASICAGCSPKAVDLQMSVKLYCQPAQGYLILNGALPQYTYDQYIYAVVHHTGHALGLIGDPATSGHSADPQDVMYPYSPVPRTNVNVVPSLRDLNTLKQLYSRPADITRS